MIESSNKIGKVLKVEKLENASFNEELVSIKVKQDGEEIIIQNSVPQNQAYAIKAQKGREYILGMDNELGEVFITDYYREPTMFSLIAIFLVMVIAFGGFRGFKALISLILTGIAIVYFLIPGIQNGDEPILLAVMIAAFATAVTMFMIAGLSKKSLAATIGTTGGVTAAGIIALAVIKLAPLSGLASTEAHLLLGGLENKELNFQGILAAGILISSLGAAMDVAISIASSAQELHQTDLKQPRRVLFLHLINIGRDIMGTMINTLILAYTGASIPLFLLLSQETGLRLINMEIIASELTAALAGSIGLILAIPLTAFASVVLLKGMKKNG